MLPHKLVLLVVLTFLFPGFIAGQSRKPPAGGRVGIVVDERLAALRATPQLNGRLVRRLGRGRMVAVRARRNNAEGIGFLLVNVSSRTHGWIQREAVVSPSRAGDDRRLLELIERSHGFDRIVRARIFLDYFPRSALRPVVLFLLGNAAEEVAARLTTEASRRLRSLGDAPEFSYYLNYVGLDRYNRQRVGFVFDKTLKRFHYDGAAWRELIRRHPHSPEAAEARKRLGRG
jgi:hypothetical protein